MSRPEVDGLNTGYAALLLEQYLDNPSAVPTEWRALFESAPEALLAMQPGLARLLEQLERQRRQRPRRRARAAAPAPAPAAAPAAGRQAPADEELLGGIAAAMSLVKAIRTHGHLAAQLDPLGSEPPGDPALEPERLIPKLTPELRRASPRRSSGSTSTARRSPTCIRACARSTAARSRTRSSISPTTRSASGCGRRSSPAATASRSTPTSRCACSARLSQVEGMERYLRRAFLGQKQFSIEGVDVMVPMLDEAIELAADTGAHEVVIGMAHRGRLNVLAHVVGRPYDVILREFEGERTIEAVVVSEEGGSGDVKYHLGASGVRATRAGEITVTLASNPSHLEAVDPVVEGRARAEQTDRSTREGYHDPPSRCRSSSTATRRSRARARSPRRSTSRVSPATRPAARCT